MTNLATRRKFITQLGFAGAATTLGFPAIVRAQNLNSKLQVGFVATGGRASAHTDAAHKAGLQCIAFAEVDKNSWNGVHGKAGWDQAKGYTDWRELFKNHGKELDVVFVATPDHSHFAPTMTAVSMGIHCYTEKPLTWSVREAQMLTAAYTKNPKVVTQMGNQGHAGQGWRLAYEFIKGGAIGDIVEFHTWTNRPVWPQGGKRPEGVDPIPENLDWESWIGPAPMRPFKNGIYHSFNWRGFVDFGSGALGDMACHTTDGIYAIMQPGYAATAEPIFMTAPCDDQFPAGMTVKATYRPTKDRPGFSTVWYEGAGPDGGPNMPPTPDEMKEEDRQLPRTGNLIIGTKGKMLVNGDYWESPRLIPNSASKAFGKPKQLLERSPGHHEEFFMACRGEKPREFSQSNFGYSGPMAANIQLGNLCARVGKKLELNEQGEITNEPAVNALAWREPRSGWGALETKI
ncbi:MAG: Gfo/Idh/MocA family oxidoreductase [Akkermansiaceae bacterium]|nr:Gfo/Idh/MocA family oxidoreductase [Akkermansiaceae bacterium]